MLVSSCFFMLVFLAIVLLGFDICSRSGNPSAGPWLLLASFLFSAYWIPIHLPLIAASIVVNFQLGKWLSPRQTQGVRRFSMLAALALHLGLIAYFKSFGLFDDVLASVSGQPVSFETLLLPLGISFFLFQQLASLIDARLGPELNAHLWSKYR